MTLSLTNQGFDYISYYDGAYGNDDSLATLQSTGANSIEASIEYGIDPKTSTVYTDANFTDSLDALGATISEAAGLGLTVMDRPLLDFVDPSDLTSTPYSVGDWRAYYNPGTATSATAKAFFASYQTVLLAEAKVAAENGATSFSIGTELDQITGPAYKSYWDSIISALRTDYPTLQLTYSAIWDDDESPWTQGGSGLAAGTGDFATQVSFASELDYIGVDEYAPLSDAADPTLQQLIAGWTQTPTDPDTLAATGGKSLIQYYESIAAATGKPLVFTELGYENATDAASSPFASSTKVVDDALQAELYQAFFMAWQQAGNSSLTGVYFWNWDPNVTEVGPGQGTNFSPQSLPAQAVVTDWFGAGVAVTFGAPAFGGGSVTLAGGASNAGGGGVTSIEIFDGSSDLGAATVNTATGAWSFTGAPASGDVSFTAVATDEYCKQTTTLAPFVLLTDAGGGGPFIANEDALNALPGGFAIYGEAEVIAGDLDAIEDDAGHIDAIYLTGGDVLTLTAAEAVDDAAALAKIAGSYQIALADTASGIAAEQPAVDDLIASGVITSVYTTGATLNIGSGAAPVITGDDDVIGVVAGATAYLTGVGDKVFGSGASIYLTSAQIRVIGGDDTIIGGAGDQVRLFSTGGQFDKVFGSDLVAYVVNAQAKFVGADDSIRCSGVDDQLKLFSTGGQSDKVFGIGLTAYVISAQASFIDGGDVIHCSGSGDAVKLFATIGDFDKVFGTGVNGYLINAQASFIQGGDTIHLLNGQDDTLKLLATGANADSVYGSGSTIDMIGAQASITGSDDRINMFENDTVTLNGGSHAFVYQPAIGDDTITGFAASDTMQFSASDFANWPALQGHISQAGANTVIALDASDMVTLNNFTAASLTASQFKFV
jgi:hypothetical protein